MKATIFEIQKNSFVDGPGIRTTVFFKGCNLRCLWCHSPESQKTKIQIMHYKTRCTSCGICKNICNYTLDECTLCGKCIESCPNDAKQLSGREYSVDEIFEILKGDNLFYETSGGGVTFSGGECMLQLDFLYEILKRCKKHGIHTAVDTAGNLPWESFEKIIPYTDMFLYDIKAISEDLHIKGTGVTNKNIFENLKRLSEKFSGDIIIRIPLIPGFNESYDEMEKFSAFLQKIKYKKVEILPYHKMGQHKYEALNLPFTEFQIPDKKLINTFENILKK